MSETPNAIPSNISPAEYKAAQNLKFNQLASSYGEKVQNFDSLPVEFQAALEKVGVWKPPQPGENKN